MRIVVFGLSITSSWGNGHATTYRGLIRELVRRGHDVLFLERDAPWYAANRDLPQPSYGRIGLYSTLDELKDRFTSDVRGADFVMVGSYVPDGVAAGKWVIATARGAKGFYDIDTPVTLAKLARGDEQYLSAAMIRDYDIYFSFTGGPTLARIEREYGSPRARVLYCSTDPDMYFPEPRPAEWEMGYLGTYSGDRQPALDRLLLEPARRSPAGRFVVAGPLFPATIQWPRNTDHIEHLAPPAHRAFYNSQKFTLNITRADMIRAGWSPSVRLFEAAACATPIVSDYWLGLETIFRIGEEILVARGPEDTLRYLSQMCPEQRAALGQRARRRILAAHTSAHRAAELEGHVRQLLEERSKWGRLSNLRGGCQTAAGPITPPARA